MRICLLLLAAAACSAYKINHVILTILENRSFENLLGWATRFNPEINGLTGNESQPLDASDPNSERFYVHDHQQYRIPVDVGHSIQAVGEQIYNQWPVPDPLPEVAPMQGFVQNYIAKGGLPEDTMGAFSEEQIPVTFALAREFAVFDRWFCSVPGPTQPNRMFAHSGTSDGMATNDTPRLVRGLPQKPIYASMVEAGYSWGDYFQEVPSIMLLQWPRRPPNWSYGHYEQFKRDAAAGTLPTLSFVEPRYFDFPNAPQNDNHPGSADVRNGEHFLKDLYETVRASPKWNETLLIITYDEHGGFHSTVPTPKDVPNPDGKTDPSFDFTRLGPRVPTLAISPWIKKGRVVHEPPAQQKPFPDSEYEHSSIPATLKKMFQLPNFLTHRDEWAGTFEHIFDLDAPREDCPTVLPDAPTVATHDPQRDLNVEIDDLQKEWVMMAGGMNGDFESGEGMSEIEAALYVRHQVDRFFGRCLHEGADAHEGMVFVDSRSKENAAEAAQLRPHTDA